MKKVHHSELLENGYEMLICNVCGSEDTRASNGDCDYCTECHSVEQGFKSCYEAKNGEFYSDNEIDWSGVPCIKCLFPGPDLIKIENRETDVDGRCKNHPKTIKPKF